MPKLQMKTLVTAAVLTASAAHASTGVERSDVDASIARARQVQTALNSGKNYADARPATPSDAGAGASADVTSSAERARRARAALDSGKNYADAHGTPTPRDPDAALAEAHRHQQAMNRGLDHEDARAAAIAGR